MSDAFSTTEDEIALSQHKMGSREYGLVLGQQLLGIDDLHYGLWDRDLPLTLSNLPDAQQRYTDLIIDALPPAGEQPRVLDIGCGTGHILGQLLHRGFAADGLVPSPSLARLVRQRLAKYPDKPSHLYECRFQDLPESVDANPYDAALFAESFQYIPMRDSFARLRRIVKSGGRVVICDFFKTDAPDDGSPGSRSFGGGHRMSAFYQELERQPFSVVRDEDITARVSPNIKLLDEILMQRVVPAGKTTDRFLTDNYPRTWKSLKRIFHFLFKKKLAKQKHKYFSGHRTQAVFERYKTYHLIVLQRNAD